MCFDAFFGIFWIDDVRSGATLAFLRGGIEFRGDGRAVDEFAEVIFSVDVAIIDTKLAFSCG